MNTTWKLAVFVLLCAALAGACADDGEGTPACPEGFIRAGDVCIPGPDLGGDVASDVAIDAPDVGPDVPPDVAPDVAQDVVADVCTGDACPDDDVLVIYEQSFESLSPEDSDALGNDGWVFFGNVAADDAASCTDNDDCGVGISCENFAGDPVCVKFGYGPNPAPTTSGFISSLVTDQGGPEQGARQLLVFSDYECCLPDDGHFDGTDLVETNVFQELTIPAAWIGRTFTFQFDGKAGDIAGATIAEAFIKTLDPEDGFRTTNEVVLDTTDLTADWGTYTVTIDMSDPLLEGQLLQFGFTTIASNFDSAGNFYDNVSMSGEAAACTVDGDCDDNNACTDNACDGGECVFTNDDDNDCTIDGNPGACNAGVCEGLCVDVTCPEEECKTYTCDPADGECDAVNDAVNTSCDLGGGATGICDGAGNCGGCSLDSECEDDNACTDNACVTGECVFTNDDTNECSVGELPGTCESGVCLPPPICEYDQDFEALVPGDPAQSQPTSLADDGWLVGATVFDTDGTTYLYDYFAFAAPNGGAGFSAVAVGEGGAGQGDQQLSIYSDYDNADHDLGRVIESLVFQERSIVEGDVGLTYAFAFDAKAGDIADSSEALAFIKTLDPDDGFATTNFLTEDTTDLPDSWGSFSIELTINADLVGQTLQYGFQTRATNYESSGVFYDNATFGTQGCGGECAVDGDCPDTGNECTTAVCSDVFACETENVADETSCDGGDGTCSVGVCVECTMDTDCDDENDCTDNTCDTGTCVFTNDDDNTCSIGELPGACNAGVCEGLCEDVTCTDPGECVTSTCDPADGVCKNANDGAGTGCNIGTGPDSGLCDGAGNCVACTMDEQCEDNNDCTDNTCDTGVCVFTNDDTNACMVGDDPGNCNAGVCEGLCEDVVCEDPGECQTSVCDPADGVCDTENDPANVGCDFGTGPDTGVCDGAGTCAECNVDEQCDSLEFCNAGACELSGQLCPYRAGLELLDPADENALGNDGWLYFGNVFDSTGLFKFGFGPFAAPTTTGQVSSIATGEGGAAQGDNQLLVFSNYDCCGADEGHFGTDLVETRVFQEVASIPSNYIGRVFTFQFDAKAGNIEGATTAEAFITTLNPAAGFSVTNEVVLDTTSLSADWATYSITLDLSDPALQGQVLQFGFQTLASNFEGAGNYYDNISFCTPDGGECVVALDCEATGNDCVAPVCDAGTCGTSNELDGTVCDDNTGVCDTGVCDPATIACEYDQDFEALDPAGETALADDGWLYFGVVYEGTGAFKFQFGPDPAPTTTGQVSGIVTGEGGADQGDKQLVVFSNYDCCGAGTTDEGHFSGTDLVETIVFQEIASIPADYIGQVFTFTFDAKRGDIGGASTAQAFIRTLNPAAGFSRTNNIVLDTTNLPDDWASYRIALDMSDPALQGQILQFGFSTIASDFDPAGNYYDNISFCTEDSGPECVVPGDCTDDGNECTTATCTDGSCGTENDTQQGASCDGGAGTCDAGTCVPTGPVACEYGQDFEALDPAGDSALGDDGWLYFGVVFDGSGAFKFQFGPGPAPTTTGQVSGIVTGQGDADQGTNQLVVFSNYDCCGEGTTNEGHFNGTDLVETIVFQEVASIPAAYIGQVFTFEFDAKRGNIAGSTTAQAFIRTLDPNAGFARTNDVVFDTTSLPDAWMTYSITLDMSDPALQGQILQFGFSTVASNFEAAGNYYDNVSFGLGGCIVGGGPECVVPGDCTDDGNECTTATCTDGSCGVENVGDDTSCDGGAGTCQAGVCEPTGGGGELTTNGDFETGDFTGWTNFCDNGTCTVTTDNPNGGVYAGSVFIDTLGANAVIKQERIGAGEVATGNTIDVELFIRGSVDLGGVVFVELFSENTGGGVDPEGLRGPFFPTNDWVQISESFTLTGSPGDGITLQIAAITSGDAGSFVDLFVDDVSVTVEGGGGDVSGCTDPTADNYNPDATVDDGSCTYTPSEASPTPPVRDPAEVISLFSDAYDDVPVNTWSTVWDNTTLAEPDPLIDGNAVKLYTNHTLAGIEFTGDNSIDATAMTHFHVDVWTPNATRVAFRLVDFGPDNGFDGGDDTQNNPLIEFTSGTDPALATGTWNSFDIPLATFESLGLANRANLSQLLIEGNPPGTATLYLDNVYFYADGGGGAVELTTNGDFETGDFTGWTNFCDNGTCSVTNVNPNGGVYAGSVFIDTLGANAVIKQERIGAGEVATGNTIDVELFIRGSVDLGGVVFVELFSENTGGGVDPEGLRGPFFPTNDWVQISESFTLTGSPGDGITLQIAAITSGDAGSFVDLFVDDVSVTVEGGGGDVSGCTDPTADNYNPDATVDDGSCTYTPSEASPTPPVRDPAEVISLFSDAYDDVPVNTWSTVWDNTTLAEPDPLIDGNAVKLYTNHTLAGIEFTGDNSIDATGMTHFHVDVWTPNATRVAFRLVDFGPDNGFDGGDDTQNNPLIEFTSGTDPALATGTWNSFDIPLATFESLGLANRANLSQLLIEGNPPGTATLYLDNVYFWTEEVVTWTAPVVFDDDYAEGVTFTGFVDDFVNNNVSVDSVEPAHSGTASLRVEVPAPGTFTGGSLLASAPADLSAYNAVVFWAKASDTGRFLDVNGFGDDTAGDVTYRAQELQVELFDVWTEYIIAIPDPSRVTAEVGLFHFAEGGEGTGYTIWFDDISYASLDPSTFTNPRPEIDDIEEASRFQLTVDDTYQVGGQAWTVAVNGSDQRLETGPGYFDYFSSAEAVATVDGVGVVTGVSVGTTDITAELAGDTAAGTTRIEAIPPFNCTLMGDNLAVNGDFESGDFSCIQQFLNGGTQSISEVNPAAGTYSANFNVAVVSADTLIKFANMAPGTFTVGQTIYISFDMRGSAGEVAAEFFSELTGGGTSASEQLFGGNIFPNANPDTWTTFSTTARTGSQTSGGVTLLLKALSGGGTADIFFDNVCVSAVQGTCVEL